MSKNLDLVRSIYAAWGRGAFNATEWADTEIEFEIVGGPDPGRWEGVAGMTEGWRGWLAAWDDYSAEADEYRELEGGRVLVFGRMHGRGKTSGVNVETAFVNVIDVRGSKVTRLRLYSERERALADLGLAE
ncbi:MAG TPA: nuclear transport factor 2 family protein [Solirubrobacteraceae bacterium]|nr:nuclear transport factor 2 family protein [Solirubrobacteraceae bacterium]